VALAGAVEEMTPLVHGVLDRFRALARPAAGAAERARPFARARDGCLAAEGATFLVLERADQAARRGARPLAVLRGGWGGFDATARSSGWGTGDELLSRELVAGLERSGLDLRDVDRIVSGASGSIAGDRLEARVLRRAWGEPPLPPLLAPKAVTGEYGGAFLGAAVLAVTGAPFGAPGAGEPDPDLGVRVHDGSLLEPPCRVLVTSLAAGGAAAWLVLERA
jgi:3-oxoacyl-[acyl-carrier-protein] synthase II